MAKYPKRYYIEKARERARRKKELKVETYEERRSKALEFGKRCLFLACPLCGRSRPLSSWRGKTFFEVKPDYEIIQVRYGGGRGLGFFRGDGGMKLGDPELLSKHPEVARNLCREVGELYSLLRKLYPSLMRAK